mmetsp:Transcript_9873/g.32154  ORF Transcript_9873/g.32154 Transcript_9873/m.32154 type:complete len:256 (+) Transcript_9873:598-1365(+)
MATFSRSAADGADADTRGSAKRTRRALASKRIAATKRLSSRLSTLRSLSTAATIAGRYPVAANSMAVTSSSSSSSSLEVLEVPPSSSFSFSDERSRSCFGRQTSPGLRESTRRNFEAALGRSALGGRTPSFFGIPLLLLCVPLSPAPARPVTFCHSFGGASFQKKRSSPSRRPTSCLLWGRKKRERARAVSRSIGGRGAWLTFTGGSLFALLWRDSEKSRPRNSKTLGRSRSSSRRTTRNCFFGNARNHRSRNAA